MNNLVACLQLDRSFNPVRRSELATALTSRCITIVAIISEDASLRFLRKRGISLR